MVNDRFAALKEAREHDPFHLLGLHPYEDGWRVTAYLPYAQDVALLGAEGAMPMERLGGGLFQWQGAEAPERPWRMAVREGGISREISDPYAFPPQPSDLDLHLFAEGRHHQAWRMLGANIETRMGVAGVVFRTWAPNAARVSLVGDFNRWDGRCHPMCSLGASGIWELFMPELDAGTFYKFEIRSRHTGAVVAKSDPYARWCQNRPDTAGRVCPPASHAWQDAGWLDARSHWDWLSAPINVYEMHAGSWMRHPDGSFYAWRELAERLVPYAQEMGFTHIELMPVTEHPLDQSWGYQTTGYFAPSSRFGTPDDLRFFIDTCHQAGIGVLLDWVPGHFPSDAWALAHYDGSALYEHEDPRLKTHPDWGTHIFNYGRNEVKSFLLSSAHYWLSEFHFDGLRVDAVASMLYLDYSRKHNEWVPNRFGGRENLEAIEFLKEFNVMVHQDFPGALTVAEESTAWPMVSRPVYLGGLGFSLKWNMGWMNDTLSYMETNPVYRSYRHDKLTFGQLYAYSENFMLPLSHDEVVHGKGSLLGKMPGDDWQKRANLRLLFAYQMTSPGKKLNFMGNELGQPGEWADGGELSWGLLADERHAGIKRLLADLGRLYRDTPALHELDVSHEGFSWLDCNDHSQSVLAYLRRAKDGKSVLVILNFTPVPREGYRIGVPKAGRYKEILNSDSSFYGGSNMGNGQGLEAKEERWLNYPASLVLTLPPLAAVILELEE
jgi:1,4-alpha-glucan branching enzyme